MPARVSDAAAGLHLVWSGWQGDVPPGADRLTRASRSSLVSPRPGREEFIARTPGCSRQNIRSLSAERFVGHVRVYPLPDPDGATVDGAATRGGIPRVHAGRLCVASVDDRMSRSRDQASRVRIRNRGAITVHLPRGAIRIVMGIGFAAIRDMGFRSVSCGTKQKTNPLAPQEPPAIPRALVLAIFSQERPRAS